MSLDVSGNVSLALSVVTLFLLILGLPLVRGSKSVTNFRRHGYFTVAALVVETILVFVVMIPAFIDGFGDVLALSALPSLNTWLHVGLGVFAEVSGLVYVTVWLMSSPSKMRCMRFKKYMLPTFIVWFIAIITGALIHLLELI